jgi:hypothetical protein
MGCQHPSDAVAFPLLPRGLWHDRCGREASTPLAGCAARISVGSVLS